MGSSLKIARRTLWAARATEPFSVRMKKLTTEQKAQLEADFVDWQARSDRAEAAKKRLLKEGDGIRTLL